MILFLFPATRKSTSVFYRLAPSFRKLLKRGIRDWKFGVCVGGLDFCAAAHQAPAMRFFFSKETHGAKDTAKLGLKASISGHVADIHFAVHFGGDGACVLPRKTICSQ